MIDTHTHKELLAQVPADKHAVLIVDLKAIGHNYNVLKDYVSPKACGAVVKDNAYGLGQDKIIDALLKEGCEHFFFAYLTEAIQARRICPDKNFYVFSGVFTDTEASFTEHNLIPSLISLNQVKRWHAYAQKLGRKLPCVINIDTGMGREGLSPQEFEDLVHNHSELLESLDIKFLMSHMGNSNMPGHPKNDLQKERFEHVTNLLPNLKRSFANSSAIFLGSDFHYDITRPGAALYGYKYCPLRELQFKTSISAYARVLLLRTVPKGETIGYDATYVCERETHIALVGVGHGDGILRQASNRGHVHLHGFPAPIIGRVSMDVVMVDITDIEPGLVQENDWAKIYGEYQTTRDFSQAEGTSVYELLVRHGARYHRIYV